MKWAARVPSQLSASLHKRLNSYALAASAAGVGVLALTKPTEAKIIYTPVAAHTGQYFYSIDFNAGQGHDFSIYYTTWNSGGHSNHSNMIVYGYPNYIIVGKGGYARALRSGAVIGSSGAFKAHLAMADVSHPASQFKGPWANHGKGVGNRYLGFKFAINGETHYGWARLSVVVQRHHFPGFLPILTGYAYETIPNKPIIAGRTKGPDVVTVQPATLGRLAAGASGIPTSRKAGANK